MRSASIALARMAIGNDTRLPHHPAHDAGTSSEQKYVDFVSGRLEPIVDERHDPAHATRSRARNLMCDEDAHAMRRVRRR